MNRKAISLILVLLLMVSTMLSAMPAWAEDDFTPENVALAANGALATASTTMPPDANPNSFKEKNMIDGIRNGSLFWSDDTPNAYPDSVQITFTRREVINTVNVFTVTDDIGVTMPTLDTTFSNFGIKDFTIEYFDGQKWKMIPGAAVTNNNKVWNRFIFDEIVAMAVRVTVTTASGYSRISEIEAWTCAVSPDPVYSPENVALSSKGSMATASSSHPADANPLSFQPSNTIDGIRNGGLFWNDNTDNAYPDWLRVDFNGRQMINTINVFTVTDDVGVTMPTPDTVFSNFGITAYQVQVLAGDGVTWITVPNGTVTGNNKVWRQFTFEPVLTRAVRINITNAKGFSRVSEVEAVSVLPSPDLVEVQEEEYVTPFGNAQWIWQSANTANTWMSFRKQFTLDQAPRKAVMNIAVDSKYYLWINDRLVVFEGGLNRGPAPGKGYYDEVDVSKYLKPGKNTVAVLVWFWGNQGRNNVNSGGGGMLASIVIDDAMRINSDKTWSSRMHPGYNKTTSGPQPAYLYGGYNIGFDARNDFIGDWKSEGFTETGWAAPAEKGKVGSAPWGQLEKRPIPLWKYSGLKDFENTIVHEGNTITMDLPYAAQITPYIKVRAAAGKTIDIRTDRYNVPGGPGDGNKYNGHRVEYITKDGEQEFEAYNWIFGEKVIFTIPADVEIVALQYRESGCDTELITPITTNDDFINALALKAQRTLYVCMRDNFMDCPDRERGQWIGDVSSQAPQVFYALGENGPDHLKKAIDNFIRNRSGDVLIGNVPGVNSSELPAQSLNAISTEGMIMQYYQFTGDRSVIDLAYEPVREYLKLWNVNADGSLINRSGNWEWYDHGSGIDGAVIGPAWYYMACEAAVQMAVITGNEQDIPWFESRMEGIRSTFDTKFWKGDGYRSGAANDDRANAMAVLSGLANPSNYPVINTVLKNVKQATPFMEGYVLEAIYKMGYSDDAMARMRDRYASLVSNENSTLWEDFDYLGTKNHAWSGGPLTVLSKYVAGIYPTAPGYETYRVTPKMGGLESLRITVPSTKGDIALDMAKTSERITMNLISPANTEAVVAVPRFAMQNTKVTVNGNAAFEDGVGRDVAGATYKGNDADYIYFNVEPGTVVIESTVKTDTAEQYTLNIDATAGGTISVNDQTVATPYSQTVTAGTVIKLQAVAGEGKQFNGYTGSFVSNETECTLTMDQNLNLFASFGERIVDLTPLKNQLTLLVSRSLTITEAKVTEQTYGLFAQALVQAKAVLQSEDSQESDYTNAIDALKSALDALQSALGINLALGAAVNASSVVGLPQFDADKLTDGILSGHPSTSNCWSSGNLVGADHAEWAVIDLGVSMDFDQFIIYPRIEGEATGYGFPKDFTISVSDDGQTWKTVVKETDYPYVGSDPQTFDIDMVNARYIKLDATSLNVNPGSGNDYRVQLAEFEVYRRAEIVPVPDISAGFVDEQTGEPAEPVFGTNEPFTVKVTTPGDIEALRFVNENGLTIGKSIVSVINHGDGTKTWVVNMSVATAGPGRVLKLYTAGADMAYTDSGVLLTFDVIPPLPALVSATADVSGPVLVNQEFIITVVTTKTIDKLKLSNEDFKSIGIISSDCVIAGNNKIWTLTAKIGTKGDRIINVHGALKGGTYLEDTLPIAVTVVKP